MALDYLADPQSLYQTVGPVGQQLLNKMIFKRLHIDANEQGVRVVGDDLQEPFEGMVTSYRRRQASVGLRGLRSAFRTVGGDPDVQQGRSLDGDCPCVGVV